jgi:hypothetical protein
MRLCVVTLSISKFFDDHLTKTILSTELRKVDKERYNRKRGGIKKWTKKIIKNQGYLGEKLWKGGRENREMWRKKGEKTEEKRGNRS